MSISPLLCGQNDIGSGMRSVWPPDGEGRTEGAGKVSVQGEGKQRASRHSKKYARLFRVRNIGTAHRRISPTYSGKTQGQEVLPRFRERIGTDLAAGHSDPGRTRKTYPGVRRSEQMGSAHLRSRYSGQLPADCTAAYITARGSSHAPQLVPLGKVPSSLRFS